MEISEQGGHEIRSWKLNYFLQDEKDVVKTVGKGLYSIPGRENIIYKMSGVRHGNTPTIPVTLEVEGESQILGQLGKLGETHAKINL